MSAEPEPVIVVPSEEESRPLTYADLARILGDEHEVRLKAAVQEAERQTVERCACKLESMATTLRALRRRGASVRDARIRASALEWAAVELRKHAPKG